VKKDIIKGHNHERKNLVKLWITRREIIATFDLSWGLKKEESRREDRLSQDFQRTLFHPSILVCSKHKPKKRGKRKDRVLQKTTPRSEGIRNQGESEEGKK